LDSQYSNKNFNTDSSIIIDKNQKEENEKAFQDNSFNAKKMSGTINVNIKSNNQNYPMINNYFNLNNTENYIYFNPLPLLFNYSKNYSPDDSEVNFINKKRVNSLYYNNFNNNLQKNDSDFISNFDQNQTNSFDEKLEASKMNIKNLDFGV
jgi:hypothetical protein